MSKAQGEITGVGLTLEAVETASAGRKVFTLVAAPRVWKEAIVIANCLNSPPIRGGGHLFKPRTVYVRRLEREESDRYPWFIE